MHLNNSYLIRLQTKPVSTRFTWFHLRISSYVWCMQFLWMITMKAFLIHGYNNTRCPGHPNYDAQCRWMIILTYEGNCHFTGKNQTVTCLFTIWLETAKISDSEINDINKTHVMFTMFLYISERTGEIKRDYIITVCESYHFCVTRCWNSGD